MTDTWFIAADVGGTNIRLGAYLGDNLVHSETHSTKAGTPIVETVAQFSKTLPACPKAVVVAAAGPVIDNAVQLTNAKQIIRGSELSAATGAPHAKVINDFEAAAWATATPSRDELITLQGAPTAQPGTRMVIGPGTGLGVGALAFQQGQYFAIPGEGGHVGISPQSSEESEIFEAFRSVWPDVFFGDTQTVEAEGILSGTGIPLLYQAVHAAHGTSYAAKDAGQIMNAAKEGSDPQAATTARIFKTHLARVAGDLALSFGAKGGVFLVGGVALKNAWLFDEEFVQVFGQGGRFSPIRQEMNLYLLNIAEFGLKGAQNFAHNVLANAAES
ncbi:MAG: glucokinase [Thalassovita sp.]